MCCCMLCVWEQIYTIVRSVVHRSPFLSGQRIYICVVLQKDAETFCVAVASRPVDSRLAEVIAPGMICTVFQQSSDFVHFTSPRSVEQQAVLVVFFERQRVLQPQRCAPVCFVVAIAVIVDVLPHSLRWPATIPAAATPVTLR